MDFDLYVYQITERHPEFTAQEINDLCEEYLSRFNKKTKESTKIKSLKKYLSKEFDMDLEDELGQTDKNNKISCSLSAIPKRLFQTSYNIISDYILRIDGLYKQLGKTVLFDDASWNIKFGKKIALVGKNGAGKSTLLKLIIGKENYDIGKIDITKGVKIGYLSQDLFWESRDRIVREEMLTALPDISANMHRLQKIEQLLDSKKDVNVVNLLEEQSELIEWMINNDGYQKYALQIEILKYFGFNNDQLDLKISQLSGGEQTKVQIAKFLLQDVDLLILDEPTNHLDIEGIMFLEKFCDLWQKTLICISHDKKFLNTVFTEVAEISNKKIYTYNGNYDDYVRQKQKAYEIQLKNYTSQQKYLKQQERFIERFRYKASKASQVQSRIKMLDKIEKIELPENDTTANAITFKIGKRLPNLIMSIEELSVGYANNILISLPTKLEITKDMRIGIIGKNGVGKTTLLKTILGEILPLYGGIEVHKDIRIGSYSQVSEELNRDSTIIDEIVGPGISHKEARTLLGSLLISEDKMGQKIATLSGGERAKVALTKMLLSRPDVIIMDEPTNHLDIPSKEIIKDMLTEFDGVSLIVSHDRDFLEGTSNLLWVIIDGKLTVYHDLERGFDDLERSCW